MSEIKAKDVVALRNKTGLGMMDCKRALEASDGDFDKAIDYLRKKGMAKSDGRADRTADQGLIETYIHAGGQLGVLIEVNCETDFVSRSDEFQELCHTLAMQIAAANPIAVRREDVPVDLVEKEIDIYREQMKNEGKPADIIDKIATGKLEKYYQECCLLEQGFIKDPKISINDVIIETANKLKENIKVRRFVRFALGE